MSNKLQKKFHRSEVKSGRTSNAAEASEVIKQIKSLKKSTELPPPLPVEAMVGDFDLMLAEMSRSLRVTFSSVRFEDDHSLFSSSSLTVELLDALTKTLGLHNTSGMFDGEENIFFFDIMTKDIFVYISISLGNQITGKDIQEYVQSVQGKIETQLRPYGSVCKIQFSEDLTGNKKNLNFIFYINRLENFSNKEQMESLETGWAVKGELHA
jgi:hypothetical protein